MPFLSLLGSTLGKVHPAPGNWVTSATKTGLHRLLRKVQENMPVHTTVLFLYVTHSPYDDSHSTPTSLLFSKSVEQGFCSNPWIPYNGHCFHLNRSLQTWPNAQKECRKEGGDLVSVHNVEEQSFVISQLGYGKYREQTLRWSDQLEQLTLCWSGFAGD